MQLAMNLDTTASAARSQSLRSVLIVASNFSLSGDRGTMTVRQ
jgi:hypothetical protein